MASTTANHIVADGVSIFYREAGSKSAPTILLLHGFPSSSHQYRNLMPLLSQNYVAAPDLPGFGFTEVPETRQYPYTLENLATSLEAFINALNLKKFSIYIFNYGAPTGQRLALKRPEAIQAIITQSGNAYEEGLGQFWEHLRSWWKSGSDEGKEGMRAGLFTFEATKWQYTVGTEVTVAPEAYYYLELHPQFHEYIRKSQVSILAGWPKNDPIFVPESAEAFTRDCKAEVHLLDTGHFAVETNTNEIAELILNFGLKLGLE